MKHWTKIVLLFITVSCTNTNNSSFSLEGRITDSSESESVYLSYPVLKNGIWYERIDTAKISDGKFRFDGEISETTPALLFFDDMDDVTLYLEPAKLRLRMDRFRPFAYEMSGGNVQNENADYRYVLAEQLKLAYETQRLAQEQNMQWLEADERDKDSLWTQFYGTVQTLKRILAAQDSLRLNFISEHMDYAITPHLLYLCSKMQRISGQSLRELYDRLPEKGRNSVMGQLAEIQTGLHSGSKGWNVGDTAPDFCRIDAAGNRIRLSDYKNKNFVLLDFWASWCGPCLRELPKIKEIHTKYSQRGLRIIGVSSDDDRNKWLHVLATHELTAYPQVLSSEPDSSGMKPFFPEQADVCALFDIESIPFFMLIDKEGRIVARWQHNGQEQFTCVDEILK